MSLPSKKSSKLDRNIKLFNVNLTIKFDTVRSE